MTYNEELYRACADLRFSVQTGKRAFDHVFGTGPFEYFAEHPEADKTFNEALVGYTNQVAQALFTAARVTRRCTCVAGDFFVEIPSGADTDILSQILHDWETRLARAFSGMVDVRCRPMVDCSVRSGVSSPGGSRRAPPCEALPSYATAPRAG
jgi:hypothetical protein